MFSSGSTETVALTVNNCKKYAPTPGMDRPSKVSMEEGLSMKALTTSASDPDSTVTKMVTALVMMHLSMTMIGV